jgi:hypothetical protein
MAFDGDVLLCEMVCLPQPVYLLMASCECLVTKHYHELSLEFVLFPTFLQFLVNFSWKNDSGMYTCMCMALTLLHLNFCFST